MVYFFDNSAFQPYYLFLFPLYLGIDSFPGHFFVLLEPFSIIFNSIFILNNLIFHILKTLLSEFSQSLILLKTGEYQSSKNGTFEAR